MDEPKPKQTREGNGRTRRRSRVEQEKVLAEYRRSGLTQEGFAAQAGIHVGTLRGWLYNKRHRSGGEEGRHFAPVRLSGARPGAVTLRWPQGMELEITTELDGAGVVSLVRELLTPCLQ